MGNMKVYDSQVNVNEKCLILNCFQNGSFTHLSKFLSVI